MAAVQARTERLRELRAHQAWLWRRHRQGDPGARDQLIEAYGRLVELTRHRIVPGVPNRLDAADLLQVGYIALVKAVDRFDPARACQFESFAISMIRGAMLEMLRREDWAPRGVRAAQKLLRRAEQELGPDAADEAIAAFLEVTPDKLAALREKADELRQVSLDEAFDGGGDADDLTAADQVADPAPGPEDLALDGVEWGAVSLALRHLPDSEREIIGHYYSGAGPTAIARGMGCSVSWVSVLRKQAVERLRGFLGIEMGDEMPEQGWPLTRAAVAALAQYRRCCFQARRNCRLSDTEWRAVEQLAANLERVGRPTTIAEMDASVAGLLEGLRLAAPARSLAGAIPGVVPEVIGALAERIAAHAGQSAPVRSKRPLEPEPLPQWERAVERPEAFLEGWRSSIIGYDPAPIQAPAIETAPAPRPVPLEVSTVVMASEHVGTNGTGERKHHFNATAGNAQRVAQALIGRGLNPAGQISEATKRTVASELGLSEATVRQALTRYRAENGITVPNAAGLNVSRQAAAAEPPVVNGREPTPLPATFEAAPTEEPAAVVDLPEKKLLARKTVPELLADLREGKDERELERIQSMDLTEPLSGLAPLPHRVPVSAPAPRVPLPEATPELRALALELASGHVHITGSNIWEKKNLTERMLLCRLIYAICETTLTAEDRRAA
jgi:RNA polymerase sigma factor for flagellar operon FliA